MSRDATLPYEPSADETQVGAGPWGESEIGEGAVVEEATAGTWLSHVIEAEVTAIERTIAAGGVAMCALGLGAAIFVTVAGYVRLGAPLIFLSFFGVGYFVFLRRVLVQRPELAALRWLSPLIEQLFPFSVTLVIVAIQGAAYALGSWVPPILFVGVTILNTLRMRPWMAVGMGLCSAALFALLQFVAAPLLDPTPLPDTALYSMRMALARCFTLAGAGWVSAAGAVALKRGINAGARRVRSAELFGKYRLGEEIAVGGMGSIIQAVYAPEGGFERPVAIKRVHAHLARDPRFVQAFRDEAELCARLSHPHIVQVFDFGRAHGTYFFAMEHVDGANLGQLIDRSAGHGRRFPPRLVAQIGVEVGEALHFAHEVARGTDGERLRVVHRDLNPRNVLVSRAGEVKLSDFGIARALRDAVSHETRHMMGSLAYLAPEQARGEPLDQRSDLFAFGLVLFELLTLRSVFDRPTDVATLRAVLEDDIPSLAALRPDLDPGWSRIVSRALARDPDERYQSASDFVRDLKAQLEEEGVPGPDELRDFVVGLLALEDRGRHAEERPTRADRPSGKLALASIAADDEDDEREHDTTEVSAQDIHGLTTMVGPAPQPDDD